MVDSQHISLIVLVGLFSVMVFMANPVYAQEQRGSSGTGSGFQFASQQLTISKQSLKANFYQTGKDSAESFNQKRIYLIFRSGLGSSAHLGESTQLAIDVKPNRIPLAFSFLSESHRKTPLKKEYSEPYDTFLYAINLLYMPYNPMEKRLTFFAGGGFGRIKMEKYERSDDPDWRQNPFAVERGFVSNLELGLHLKLIWKLGFYAEGKYLYAQKKKRGETLIDINSTAWMIGLTLNVGLFNKYE